MIISDYKSKDVLLIFPQTGIDLKGVNLQMPMGLMCLAAVLVEKGYKVTILDQRVTRDFFKKLKQALKNRPICVGLTSMTGSQILYGIKISTFIRKNSGIPIVWGGTHPTLTAEQTLRNKNIDIVVRGEGEITFWELVDTLFIKKSLEDIKGVSWKAGEKICHNPEREVMDLNTLPPIPYHLVDMEEYVYSQIPGRKRSLDVYTSRGCPGSCIFCYNRSLHKSRFRARNIDAVIKEIEFLVKEFNLDSVFINDDNFFVDAQRSHYFCECLTEKKIVPEWGCQGVRVDSLEKIDFDILEKSGCSNLYVGIESGSEKILKYIKKQISIKQIKNIIDRFAGSRIIAHYNFMVGYPIEGIEELSETMDLVDHIMKVDPKAHFSSFHSITPYPGTEFYDIAKGYGFIPPSTLEGWANIRWETENTPWVSSRMRTINSNITWLTYFIDGKVLYKTKDRSLSMMIIKVLMALARLRWKHRIFEFCPECYVANKLINYKINMRK